MLLPCRRIGAAAPSRVMVAAHICCLGHANKHARSYRAELDAAPLKLIRSVCAAGSCDAVVVSLALMGSDYSAFLREAARVLHLRGYLWIAEVRSRFVPTGGSVEDFAPFLSGLERLGFKLLKQDVRNKMFVVWVLQKVCAEAGDTAAVEWPVLKPCIYKRR